VFAPYYRDTSGNVWVSQSGVTTIGKWYKVLLYVSATNSGFVYVYDLENPNFTLASIQVPALSGLNAGFLGLGASTLQSGSSLTVVFDDILIADGTEGIYGDGGRAILAKPNAAGTESGWTGSGTYTNVTQFPNDGNTTTISSSTTGSAAVFQMEDGSTVATGAFRSPIRPVKPIAIARGSGGMFSTRLRSGSSVANSATFTASSSYAVYAAIYATSPFSGSAWQPTELDGIQVGVLKQNTTTTYVTSIGLYVWDVGIVYAYLYPQADATSSASGAITVPQAPAYFNIGSGGAATANAAVAAAALLGITADGAASAASGLSAPALLSLSMPTGAGATAATLGAPAYLLASAGGAATANAAVRAAAQLVLNAGGAATVTALASAPALLALGANGAASTLLSALTTNSPILPYMMADGVGAATAGVRSPLLFVLAADSAAGAALQALTVPALLAPAAAGAAGTAAALKAAAPFELAASGAASAGAALRARALFAMGADGLGGAWATLATPLSIGNLTAAGTSTADGSVQIIFRLSPKLGSGLISVQFLPGAVAVAETMRNPGAVVENTGRMNGGSIDVR
jgi:hypothetical protein